MANVNVLMCGDVSHGEFRETEQWLASNAATTIATSLEEAAGLLERGSIHAQVIVIAQSRPSQFSSSQIERLHRAAPLARLVALLGSWCEGEMRSGQPWHGVQRVYWYQWKSRLADELQRMATRRNSTLFLPRTSQAADQLLVVCDRPTKMQRGLIAIRTDSGVSFRGLADVCQHAGYGSVWLRNESIQLQSASAFIWDTDRFQDEEVANLSRFVAAEHPAPVIVTLHFPRAHEYEAAIRAGAAAVVAKPFFVNELLDHLESAIKQARPTAVPAAPAA